MFIFPGTNPATIPYSGPGDPKSFLELVKLGEVAKVTQSGQTLDIELNGKDQSGQPIAKQSLVPSEYSVNVQSDIVAACESSSLCAQPPSLIGGAPSDSGAWLSILLTVLLPMLLIGALLFFMFRQAQGTNNQALCFGKSRARMFLGNKTVVTFQDVAGVDEAKTELQEVVEFLKYPEKFNQLGARIPRGVLLVGPAGHRQDAARSGRGRRGRRARSSASPAPSSSRCSSASARARVRDLFDQAKRNSPCIVFVDEIDAVGRQRGAGLGGSHDEREQTLNQILVEMDGFDTNTNVIVVAATNRPDVLDPALLRPGRFDRQVILDRPDMKGRLEILKVHIKGKPLDKAGRPADRSPASRPASPAPTWPTSSTRRRSWRRDATRRSSRHGRVQRGARARRRRPGAQEPRHQRRREGDHRLPRGRPRHRPARPAQDRPGRQGQHHQPRHGPRLHDGPADRGSLPAEQERVRGQDRRHARRQRGREADLRRHDDRLVATTSRRRPPWRAGW